MESESGKPKYPKTAKARDWFCAMLIRLPMIILIAAVFVIGAFLVTLVVAPDKAQAAWQFLSGIGKK